MEMTQIDVGWRVAFFDGNNRLRRSFVLKRSGRGWEGWWNQAKRTEGRTRDEAAKKMVAFLEARKTR